MWMWKNLYNLVKKKIDNQRQQRRERHKLLACLQVAIHRYTCSISAISVMSFFWSTAMRFWGFFSKKNSFQPILVMFLMFYLQWLGELVCSWTVPWSPPFDGTSNTSFPFFLMTTGSALSRRLWMFPDLEVILFFK